MLNEEIRRKIDDCRNILLVKLPIPTDQVKQITLALIYKFMDDMDKAEVELGGKPTFFAGKNAKYAWKEIIKPSLAGPERVKLYNAGLERISQNPGINPLYQEIFKDAYLPFKDPDVLFLFLKAIDWFKYEQNGDIGDAFEYLLKTMGAQGNAGQFLTPRHIIDFIVDCVNPTKEDTILDPACGTGGFLISAYNHIKKQNTNKKPWDLLKTKTARTDIAKNITGFDISHDMVRLSSVNLFLHKFPNPNIYEYDTLVDESKWDDKYSCILANPPFMTPKGGIKPHDRFQIEANRAEVLFVDYILEHLKANGKAGIIVPEGIIFQSATAYVALRKMALENGLYAVVSLPSGVFNPYSGVKTSILLIDKSLKTKDVLFVKINNDGKDLGSQRRDIQENDIRQATELIKKYKEFLREGKKFKLSGNDFVLANITEKKKVLENDFNLSGERYKESIDLSDIRYPLISLGNTEYFDIEAGGTPSSKKDEFWGGDICWATLADISSSNTITKIINTERKITHSGLKNSSAKLLPVDTILISSRATIGRIGIAKVPLATNQGFKNIIIKNKTSFFPEFVAFMISFLVPEMKKMASGGTFKEISKSSFSKLVIPQPPLDIQKKIVEELDGYQKIIDGAQQVINNWKPIVKINPSWPIKKLGDVCKTSSGGTPLKNDESYYKNGKIPWLRSGEVSQGHIYKSKMNINELGLKNSSAKIFPINTVLVAMYGATAGQVGILKFEAATNQAICGIYPNDMFLPEFLFLFLLSKKEYLIAISTGGAQPNISQKIINEITIPIPPIPEQKEQVDLYYEQFNIINSNKKLIEMMKINMKERISEIWGK